MVEVQAVRVIAHHQANAPIGLFDLQARLVVTAVHHHVALWQRVVPQVLALVRVGYLNMNQVSLHR